MEQQSRRLRIVPTGAALGADVWGVDLATIDDETFAAVYRAWLEHDGVLRIPAQELSEEEFIALAGRFGELDRAPVTPTGGLYRPDLPNLTVISNIVENGKPIGGLGSAESKWHTDMSYNEVPPKASILFGVEVPPEGGDTGYCNMYAAYEALPNELKTRIAGLSCKHDASRNSVGEVRSGNKERFERREEIPGAVHPLVIRHPETGRKALYLGRRAFAYIPELPDAESDALLDEVWAHATQPAFTWYQRWRLGDVVIWDNRCTLHRRDSLDPNVRRLMHRAQIKGQAPERAAA